MSDKANLSDIPSPRQAGRNPSLNELTKRRRRTHHRQVIRADLDPRSRPASPTRRRSRSRAGCRQSARAKTDLGESPGTASLSAAGGGSGLGAGERKGRGGRAPVLRRGQPCLARRLPAPRPARRRGAALSAWRSQSAAASAKILRLNADAARAARPALRRRRRRPGRGEAASAVARPRRPAAQPRPRPACRRRGAARPGRGPERPRGKPEGLRRGGRSGFRGRQGRRPAVFAPSRTPQPPTPKFWRFGRSISSLRIRLRWPRPVPLIATKLLDPGLRSDGEGGEQGLATLIGQNAAAGGSPSPPPPPSTSPPISPAAPNTLIAVAPKLRAKTGAKNRRPPARPGLRLAGRSGPPRADDRPRRPPAVRPPRRARRRARAFRAGPPFRLYGL